MCSRRPLGPAIMIALAPMSAALAGNPSVVTWRAVVPPDPTVYVHPDVRWKERQPAAYRIRLRRLDADIRIAREIVKSRERRVAEYEKFERHRRNHPLFLTLENARLDLFAASERLTELKRTRLDLLQSRHRRGWGSPSAATILPPAPAIRPAEFPVRVAPQ